MYSINSIDKQVADLQGKINAHMATIEKLMEHKQNIENFNVRYADLIGGPDGIFGALSDEVLLHIISYLDVQSLQRPLCRRFLCLREYFLRHYKYNIDPISANTFITKIFIYPIVFHVAMITKKIENPNDNYWRYTINTQSGSMMKCVILNKSYWIVNTTKNKGSTKLSVSDHDRYISVYTKKYIVKISKDDFNYKIFSRKTGGPVKLPGIFDKINKNRNILSPTSGVPKIFQLIKN
jgi:hypothetical protein